MLEQESKVRYGLCVALLSDSRAGPLKDRFFLGARVPTRKLFTRARIT